MAIPGVEALRRFDLRRLPDGGWLAGVDEAGRGALAGPVVAAAVFVSRRWFEDTAFRGKWARANDSKQLTAAARERLCQLLEGECAAGHLAAASGSASVAEIERHNILGATRLAMQRSLEAACPPPWELPRAEDTGLFAVPSAVVRGRVLVDGRPLRPFPIVHEAVVKGDGKSLAIALASILAKVTRDRLMEELDGLFPVYGFRQHKGYGTEAHRAALLSAGPCAAHRPVFLRKLRAEAAALAGEVGSPQAELFGMTGRERGFG
jgi:ribonuclease HII